MKKIRFLIPFLLLLIVCQATFATGWQTEVKGVSKKMMKDVITADFIRMGFSVLDENKYKLVFGADSKSFLASFFFGSNFNSTPQIRVTFGMAQIEETTRLNMNVQMVTNPGSSFEKYTPITHPSWFSYLSALNGRFYGYVGYGFTYYPLGKHYEVGYIFRGSSAAVSGLRTQDRIIKINGKKASGMKFEDFGAIIREGDEGTDLELVVKHFKGPEETITLSKSFIEPEFKPDLVVQPATNESLEEQEQDPQEGSEDPGEHDEDSEDL